MSADGGKTSRAWEPQRSRPQAHSPASQLPAGALVFFLLDVVPKLAWSRFYAPYEQDTRGGPPFEPAMLVCLLRSASCVGVFASRQMALACERHVAFLAMVGEERPDCRTIRDFRPWPLEAFQAVCVQGVRVAGAAGLVQLGNVATDGTTIQGHASRHQAMSDGSMPQAVARLREAIEALVTQADWPDEAAAAVCGRRRGAALPAEWSRRETRLAQIAAAMRRWEEPAKREAEDEWQRRAEAEAERQRQGEQRRGRARKPVDETPSDKAPMRCTDAELHSMRTHNTGGDDGGHAQARVDAASQIIVACDVTDETHAKKQAEPMAQAILETLAHAGSERPTEDRDAPAARVATLAQGYDSEAAAQALEERGFDPYRAAGRGPHHGAPPETPEAPTTAQERMAAKVRSALGRAWYARRTVIAEPVLGQSKAGRGCRRFALRGLTKMRGAWCVVCLTPNLLKIWRYGCAPRAA